MMKDFEIKVNSQTSMINLKKGIIGNDGENLQGIIKFIFEDNFVNGQARLEYQIECKKYWIPLEKVGESYQVPIKSVLTREGRIDMQLVITQGIDPEEIPIFKSNMFYVYCSSSLNVIMNEPDKYNEWLERANTILNQMDNYDIEAIQEEKGGKVTITKKDGTKKTIQLSDGATFTPSLAENGDLSWTNDMGKENPKTINIRGPQGPTYNLTDKDRLEIGNIASSNAESTFKKYYDTKVEDFNTNATNKTSDFDSNATKQVEAYNTNANTKTKEYNENTIAKTNAFNENATNKTNDYDTNHDDKLKAYNDNATTQTNSYNTNANKKLEAYNTNDTTKTTAYNENTAQKTKEFNLNAKAKLDEFNKNASSYDQRISDNFDEINRLTDEVSENDLKIQRNSKRIENVETALYKKGEASGEFINIQDSALSEVKDIKGSINKAQDTTKGYQMYDISKNNQSDVLKVVGNTIELTTSGTTWGGGSIKDLVPTAKEGDVLYLNAKTEADRKFFYVGEVWSFGTSKTITNTILNTQLVYYSKAPNEKTIISDIVISKENNPKWEPYTGGIPAPNPNYPREIAKQSGVVEITSTGKNLFELANRIKYPNTFVQTDIVDFSKNYFFNGYAGSGYYLDINLITDYKIEDNKLTFTETANAYGFAFNVKVSQIKQIVTSLKSNITIVPAITYYDKNGKYISFVYYELDTPVIIPKNAVNAIITFVANAGAQAIMTDIQLEIGEKATPYEPYQSITEKVDLKENVMLPYDELVRLINQQDNKLWWYLKKNWEESEITGDEPWRVIDNGLENQRALLGNPRFANVPANSKVSAISNYFKGEKYTYMNSMNSSIFLWYANHELAILLKNKYPQITDLASWKKFIKDKKAEGNPVIVAYELTDEYKQLIPLQPVQNFNMTYNPITNIFSNRVNLLLDVSYNRDFVYTIKNLQVDKDTLENQLKDLETRVLALENKPATINESEVIPNEDLLTK